MNPFSAFLAWRERRRLARIAEAAERRREALKRQIAYRVEAHAQRSRHQAMLFEETCVSLAASAGRVWQGRRT